MSMHILLNNASQCCFDPLTVAHYLLGSIIVVRGVRALIVEVEAYGSGPDGPWPDQASHAYRGQTKRNTSMFGPSGYIYIYRSYGIHTCANIVCGPPSVPAAVLLRSAKILDGYDTACQRRGIADPDHTLARGPGNLCQALGITIADDGIDLCESSSPIHLYFPIHPLHPCTGPRVGVSHAADRPWRLWLVDYPEVSSYRRSKHAPIRGASD